jgi:hypothetical protein
MAAKPKDPTEAMRLQASRYPGVVKGTSCTQSSFKTAKSAFLYVGMQGGRHKAMFKLEKSRAEAERLAAKHPDDYQTGNTGWVTARFSAEKPMPASRWKKWLDESYALAVGPAPKKRKAKKSAKRKPTTKKPATKRTARTARKKRSAPKRRP